MKLNSFLKKAFLVVLSVCFSLSSIAQQQSETPEFTAKPRNLIKVAPLAFIHGQVPFGVESKISYERVIGPKSSLGASYSHIGTNPVFGFIGGLALNATVTAAITLYGKPGKIGFSWSKTTVETSGYRYQFQYKHYLSKKTFAPEGFYLSPHYSYAEADYDVMLGDFDLDFKFKAKNRNYNMLFGYQDVLGKHFVIEVFTGLGYKSKSTKIYDGEGNYLGDMKKGFPLKISSGFNLGWAF